MIMQCPACQFRCRSRDKAEPRTVPLVDDARLFREVILDRFPSGLRLLAAADRFNNKSINPGQWQARAERLLPRG